MTEFYIDKLFLTGLENGICALIIREVKGKETLFYPIVQIWFELLKADVKLK